MSHEIFNIQDNVEVDRVDPGMKVEVHLLSQSKPILYENVDNAYTKDGMYCVLKNDIVSKFPMCNIFRAKETY